MPFVTFEGIEGCGKSTQARALADALGPGAVVTAEPGATAFGRKLRELLLDRSLSGVIDREAELLLFLADRVQHVNEVIRPSLERGLVVVCDRFSDSTIAYQGHGRGVSIELIRTLSRAVLGDLAPDLTVLLDLPVEVGLARAGRRGARDRFECEERAFHERVRAGFRQLAAEEPRRFLVVDASRPPDEIVEQVRAEVRARGWWRDGVR